MASLAVYSCFKSSMQLSGPRDASYESAVKRDQPRLGKCGLMTLKCPRKIACRMAGTLLGLLGVAALAQQPNAPQDKPPATDKASTPEGQAPAKSGQQPIRVTTNTVVVPVTVKDRAGNLVADLRKDE